MPGVVALRSKWAAGKAVRAGLAVEGAYLDRYVTEEQRSRRPILIATLRAARLLTGCFVAHQPKFAAAPLHQSLTWCTNVSETGMSSVSTTNICGTDKDFDRPLRDGASLHRLPRHEVPGYYQPVPAGQNARLKEFGS